MSSISYSFLVLPLAQYSHSAMRSSASLPLSILLLHPLLILGIPLRLLRIRHILDPATTIATAAAASFNGLAALRIVVPRLLHGGLAVVLPGSVDGCAVGGIAGGLLRGAVAGSCLAVGGGHVAAAGDAEGGGAGEVVGRRHGCGGGSLVGGLVWWFGSGYLCGWWMWLGVIA
jgi:hypothetical protein